MTTIAAKQKRQADPDTKRITAVKGLARKLRASRVAVEKAIVRKNAAHRELDEILTAAPEHWRVTLKGIADEIVGQ